MIRRNKEILADFLRDVWNDGSVKAAERYVAPRYTIHHDPGDPWESQTLDLAGFKERVRRSRGRSRISNLQYERWLRRGTGSR